MRVLSRDQEAVADDVRRPVGLFRKDGAQFEHLVFDEERHDFGEAHRFFLTVGEAGHFLALDQRLAVRRLDVTQRAGGMTHDADRLAGGKERFDQLDGVFVFGEIPHRAMAARVEQGVEILLPDAVETNGLAELSFRGRVLLEPDCQVGAGFGFVALGVERRSSALWRRQRDLDAGVLEDVVGSRELFEPEAGLSSGVAQLVVGCDNHQHLHDCLLCLRSLNEALLGIAIKMLRRIASRRSLLPR
jgi:hypothetical protein